MSDTEKTLSATTALTPPSKRDAMAKDIAFGVQQTLACWATDAIDPPLSKFIQNRIGDPTHKVTDKHVWYGEIAGDSAALFEFLAVKKLFRPQLEGLTAGVKKLFNPVFERVGRKQLKQWAQSHHLDEGDEKYRRKLEKNKDFQAHAAVDSALVAAGATFSNVAVQKYVGNRQTFKVILASKLAGAAITMGLMLGARAVVPNTMGHLDEELSDKYFSKVTHSLQRLAGVAPGQEDELESGKKHDKHHHHTSDGAANAVANAAIATGGVALTHFAMDLEPVESRIGELGWKGKTAALAAGGAATVAAANVLVPESVQILKHELSERYFGGRRHKHEEHEEKEHHRKAHKAKKHGHKRWSEAVESSLAAEETPTPRLS